MAAGLSPDQADLLRRIEGHAFDAPGATQSFEERLAGENGWTLAFARRAIDEYRRFAFLYAATGRPAHERRLSRPMAARRLAQRQRAG